MKLHKEILEAADEKEMDPERKKNRKEVEKLIKQLEASAKAPKKKKTYEMSLGEADAALQSIKEEEEKELVQFLETKNEISAEEFQRLQKILQSMGGKIVAGGKSVKDSLVVQFPASKEKSAREIKNMLEKRSRRISITLRKEGGKVFLTMRGDK